jgi:hypothetical protein
MMQFAILCAFQCNKCLLLESESESGYSSLFSFFVVADYFLLRRAASRRWPRCLDICRRRSIRLPMRTRRRDCARRLWATTLQCGIVLLQDKLAGSLRRRMCRAPSVEIDRSAPKFICLYLYVYLVSRCQVLRSNWSFSPPNETCHLSGPD